MEKNKLYDLTGLLEMVGDEEGLTLMISVFLRATPKLLITMKECLANGNPDQLSLIAHQMKSSVDLLKIGELQELIRMIDKPEKVRINQGQLDVIINKIDSALTIVFEQMKKEFSL